MRSEVIDLLVSVYIGRLHQHFVCLLSADVLLSHLDASLDLLHIGLLFAQLALLNRCLDLFVRQLEVALRL